MIHGAFKILLGLENTNCQGIRNEDVWPGIEATTRLVMHEIFMGIDRETKSEFKHNDRKLSGRNEGSNLIAL